MERSPRAAFTLIELLVVIAIIGILMSLLFPALNSATTAAKKAEARNDVAQIATAITAYQTEYGQWPTTNASEGSNTVSGDMLLALAGSNSRQIVFLETTRYKPGKGGTNSTNGAVTYCDPWGQAYSYIVDADYNNSVTAPGGTLSKTVAVWSTGVPTNTTPNGDTNKFIESW